MENVLEVARELGYMTIPEGLIIDLNQIDRYPREKLAIITTGSQGEPMSALNRMAHSDHKKWTWGRAIWSSSPRRRYRGTRNRSII
jgi:ribonuclease J